MCSDEKDKPGDRGRHQDRADEIADPTRVGIVGRLEVHLSLEIYGPSSEARRRYKDLHQEPEDGSGKGRRGRR